MFQNPGSKPPPRARQGGPGLPARSSPAPCLPTRLCCSSLGASAPRSATSSPRHRAQLPCWALTCWWCCVPEPAPGPRSVASHAPRLHCPTRRDTHPSPSSLSPHPSPRLGCPRPLTDGLSFPGSQGHPSDCRSVCDWTVLLPQMPSQLQRFTCVTPPVPGSISRHCDLPDGQDHTLSTSAFPAPMVHADTPWPWPWSAGGHQAFWPGVGVGGQASGPSGKAAAPGNSRARLGLGRDTFLSHLCTLPADSADRPPRPTHLASRCCSSGNRGSRAPPKAAPSAPRPEHRARITFGLATLHGPILLLAYNGRGTTDTGA